MRVESDERQPAQATPALPTDPRHAGRDDSDRASRFVSAQRHRIIRAQTWLAETGNSNQRGNRNALSRKRQRHTRNPNADHPQNPVAPVGPPVSSEVHRRRCGARRGASGKVRAENSYRNWRGGAGELAPNSNQCCERDFKTRNSQCRTTRGDPDFSAALSRCGVVRCY